ncbi:10817_t:CDS:2, partial [Racocetra persica]
FKHIAVKCEISTEATFIDYDNPFRYLTGIKIEGGFLGAREPSTEQEAQTDRIFKSTYRNFLDKSIEPSQFNANTIDFHYSLGDKHRLAANGLSVQWHKYGNFGTKEGGEKLDQPDFKYQRSTDYIALGSNAWDEVETEIRETEEYNEGQENTGGDTVAPASTA